MLKEIKKIVKKIKYLRKIAEILIKSKIKRETKVLAKNRKQVINEYDKDTVYLNIGANRFVRHNWRLLDYVTKAYNYKSFPPELIDYNYDLNRLGAEDKFLPINRESIDYIYITLFRAHKRKGR